MAPDTTRSSGLSGRDEDGGASTEGSWSVFRQRGFARLWISAVLTQLGVQTVAFSLPLALFVVTRNAFEASIIGGAYALTSILSRVPAGVLVDRWNRKRTLISALALHCLLLVIIGMWVLVSGTTLLPLLIMAVSSACIASVYSPTQTAMIRALVSRAQLPAAMSQYVARQYVAGLAGPALGGILISVNAGVSLLLPAALMLTSVMLVLTLRPTDQNASRKERKPFFVEMSQGIRFIGSRPAFRWIVIFTSTLTLAVTMFFFAIALRVVDLGIPTSAVGVIESMSAIGLIGGAVIAPWLVKRAKISTLAISAGVILAAGFLVASTTGALIALCVIVVVIVLPVPAADAAGTAYIIAVTPSEFQGRVGSTVGFVTNLFTPLAPIIVSTIVALAGTAEAVIACSIVALIAAASMTAHSVRHAHLEADASETGSRT